MVVEGNNLKKFLGTNARMHTSIYILRLQTAYSALSGCLYPLVICNNSMLFKNVYDSQNIELKYMILQNISFSLIKKKIQIQLLCFT